MLFPQLFSIHAITEFDWSYNMDIHPVYCMVYDALLYFFDSLSAWRKWEDLSGLMGIWDRSGNFPINVFI